MKIFKFSNSVVKFFAIFLSLLILTSCDNQNSSDKTDSNKSNEQRVLRVATSADYPPFEFMSNGEIVGYDIDLANMIGKKLGMEVKIEDMPFSSVIGALNDDKADMALSGLSINNARSNSILFSTSYYESNIAILFRKADPIKNMEDLYHKKVATQTGSIMQAFLSKYNNTYKSDISILILDNNLAAVQELELGRISAVLLEKAQAINIALNKPNLSVVDVNIPTDFSMSSYGSSYAIGFPKDDQELRDKVNTILEELKKDGELKKLEDKWLTVKNSDTAN